MTLPTPMYLTETDVGDLVTLNDAISALEKMLGRETGGQARNIPKALATFGDRSSLHSLGSFSEDAKLGGFKTWVNTPKGATAVMSLFGLEYGNFLGLMQAGLLGKLRTAGIAGLATDFLAPIGAADMAIIGSGRQAAMQIASVAAVRKLDRLRVFSPTPQNRKKFVAEMRTQFSFEIEESDSLEAALDGAEIVTTVTRAKTPFVTADMIAPNAHVNAVGSVLPANGEIEASVIEKARMIVVDSIDGVRQNSREFKDYFGNDDAAWSGLHTLGEVVMTGRSDRPAGMTLFKAMGMGISDLALAEMVLDRVALGRGVSLDTDGKMPLARWNEKCE